MDNRVLIIGAGVVVVGAAIGGGYYVGHSNNPPPSAAQAPAPQPAPDNTMAPAPQDTAPTAVESQPAPAPGPIASAPVRTPPAPVARQPRPPVVDYSSGEDEAYAPPPSPPPPPQVFRDRPNPFAGRVTTFPMRHSGSGTIASPLTWTAQTEWASGREADLRISILVPEPGASDNGTFWRKWSGNSRQNLLPDVTRGTPVVVTGSASIIVAVDPGFLDLDSPAVLAISGRDGQRLYRSYDVAPARGESWDSRGARWIFTPDADFYRMLRDGANISISLRTREPSPGITIPFATNDFPYTARQFEISLARRLNAVAAGWNRVRPGAPLPPPPPPGTNPLPPPPQTGPFPPPPAPGASYPGHGPGSHGGNPRDAANAALVNAYRPPANSCGAQPAYPASDPKTYATYTPQQLKQAKPVFAAEKTWVVCNSEWVKLYGTSVTDLGNKVADRGQTALAALQAVNGGKAIAGAYDKARQGYAVTSATWKAQYAAFKAALTGKGGTAPATPPASTPTTPPPAKPNSGGNPGQPGDHPRHHKPNGNTPQP